MKKLKIIYQTIWIVILCIGIIAPGAVAGDSDFSKKIVTFHDDVTWEEIKQYAQEWEEYGVSIVMELPIINGLALRVPPDVTTSDLADDPRVFEVEDDQKLKLQGVVKGQYASFVDPVSKPPPGHYPWGILKLYDQYYDPGFLTSEYENDDLPDLVELAFNYLKVKKIRIAIFDTGIQYYHRNFSKVVKGGIDLVNTNNGDKRKKKGKLGAPLDDNGHGSHVAGIICAALDHGGKWGKGAQIELYSVKILDEKAMGDLSNIIMGLQWAIDNDIDIVNMSIGYSQDSQAVRRAVHVAHNAGLIMVASVGNQSNWDDTFILAVEGGAADGGAADGGAADGGAADGGAADGGAADGGAADGGAADGGAADGGAADGGAADGSVSETLPIYSVMYPARYPEIISVGASTPFGELASYSNFGEEMDVMAPGSNIVSVDVTNGHVRNGFGVCSGTSQAASHVTAAAALMLSLDPTLGPKKLKNILLETSTITAYGPAGEINLAGALERIIEMGQN